MESFWRQLCGNLNVPEDVTGKWLSLLLTRYSLPERFYHNEDVMFLTHKLPHLTLAKDPAVALACLFQYLEYRPKTDLSDENCALFREFATEAALNDNQGTLITKVLRLLGEQQTLSDEGEVPDEDFNFFQDLDLAVLGSSESEYAKYRDLLRKEFPELDDESYNKMRLKVLQSLVTIPSIYSSEAFASLEFTARANIEKEIQELSN